MQFRIMTYRITIKIMPNLTSDFYETQDMRETSIFLYILLKVPLDTFSKFDFFKILQKCWLNFKFPITGNFC